MFSAQKKINVVNTRNAVKMIKNCNPRTKENIRQMTFIEIYSVFNVCFQFNLYLTNSFFNINTKNLQSFKEKF